MRLFPLSLVFAMSVANAQTVSVIAASTSPHSSNDTLFLEPEGDIRYCGTMPVRLSDRVTVDISNFAMCMEGRDKKNILYSCSIEMMQSRAWQTMEELFAQGQRVGAGMIAVSAKYCAPKSPENG